VAQKGEEEDYAEFGQMEVTEIYLREREEMRRLLALVIFFRVLK